MKRLRGQRLFCVVDFIKCKCCNNIVLHSRILRKHNKTCSDLCKKKYQGILMSERLSKIENRTNYGRHRRSYMEQSFENWLEENAISFETEVRFKNNALNKNYFVDFFFRDKNLIIELDGTQHRNTVESDKERDAYFENVLGISVIRITHKEYQNGSRIKEVCERLGIKSCR